MFSQLNEFPPPHQMRKIYANNNNKTQELMLA